MDTKHFEFQNYGRRKGTWVDDPIVVSKPIYYSDFDPALIEILEIIEELEPQIVKINDTSLKNNFSYRNIKLSKGDLNVLLLFCATSGNEHLIDILLTLGADPTHKFYKGWTCYHWCASLFRLHALDLLINHRTASDITNLRDKYDLSPLDILHHELLNISSQNLFITEDNKSNCNHKDSEYILNRSERLVSWGDGSNYVLGHGDTHHRVKPKRIASIDDNYFTCVSTSFYSSAVITSDYSLYVWGLFDRLGIKSNCILVPQKVHLSHKIKSVSISDNHGACVTKDGLLYKFGNNDGKSSSNHVDPKSSPSSTNNIEIHKMMTNVKIYLNNPLEHMSFKVKEVSCSNTHTALITKTGQCWTFGNGQKGQLGHGTFNNEANPRIVTSLTNSNITFLSTGGQHTLVGTDKNDIYVLGFNNAVPKRICFDFGYPSLAGPDRFKIAKVSSGFTHYLIFTEQNDLFSYVDGVDRTPIKIYGNNSKDSSIFMEIKDVSCWEDQNYIITKDGRLYHFSNDQRLSFQIIPLTQRLIHFSPNKSHFLATCQSSFIDDALLNAIQLPQCGQYLIDLIIDNTYADVEIVLNDSIIHAHSAILSRLPYFENSLKTSNKITLLDVSRENLIILIYWIYTNKLDLVDKPRKYIKEMRSLFKRVGLEQTFSALINPSNIPRNMKEEIPQLKSYLESLVNNEIHSDCTLLLDPMGGEDPSSNSSNDPIRLYAHKFILIKRSEWFSTAFSGYWSASIRNEVKIPTIKHSLLMEILNFCYADELNESLNIFELLDIAILSEHLLINDLKLLASHRIVKLLKPDNIAFVLEISAIYKLEVLENLSYTFVIQNLELLIRLNSLQSMDKNMFEKIQTILNAHKQKFHPIFIDRDTLSKFKKIIYNWKKKFILSESPKQTKEVENNQKQIMNEHKRVEAIKNPLENAKELEIPVKSPWGVDRTSNKISLLEIQKNEIKQTSKLPSPRLNTSSQLTPKKQDTNEEKNKTSNKPSPKGWGNLNLHDEDEFPSPSNPISIKTNTISSHQGSNSPSSPWKESLNHQQMSFRKIQQEQQINDLKPTKSLTEIMNEEIILKEHQMVEEYYAEQKKKKEEKERSLNSPRSHKKYRGSNRSRR